MTFFCTDMDNTLIFSYRHDIGKNKVLVETMEGKELSYMSEKAFRLLKKLAEKKEIVPVSTRSVKQYNRINLGSDIKIKYALVANGGILIENGIENKKWFEESLQMAKDAESELEKAIYFLKQHNNITFEIRLVDNLFIFTKSDKPEETVKSLKLCLDENKVYIDSNGVKIYVFPKALDKGTALLRLKKYIGNDSIFIAAGDSDFDIPMIEMADYGLCHNELGVKKSDNIFMYPKKHFTEKMLEKAIEL